MFELARPTALTDHLAMSLIVEEPKLLLDTRSPLGEGPLWDADRKVLWWVDILECLVQCYDPADGSNRKWNICLLYTSPSPRDATLSRMPSSA